MSVIIFLLLAARPPSHLHHRLVWSFSYPTEWPTTTMTLWTTRWLTEKIAIKICISCRTLTNMHIYRRPSSSSCSRPKPGSKRDPATVAVRTTFCLFRGDCKVWFFSVQPACLPYAKCLIILDHIYHSRRRWRPHKTGLLRLHHPPLSRCKEIKLSSCIRNNKFVGIIVNHKKLCPGRRPARRWLCPRTTGFFSCT